MKLPTYPLKQLFLLLAIITATFVSYSNFKKIWAPFQNYTLNNKYSVYVHPIESLPASDYKTVMNLSNFYFLSLPVCHFNPLLLIFVYSAPKHFVRRKSIRDTWGKGWSDVKVVFMLGRVQEPILYKILRTEYILHKDIVTGSFIDAYKNLTYKYVMGFKYAIYHCPGAKYVLKIDDDSFINMPVLMTLLTKELSPFGCNHLMMCNIRHHPPVLRGRSKWHISFDEYNQSYYPDYCEGWSVLYSPDVVFKLYKQAQISKFFWIDDVFMTGMVAKKVGIHATDIANRVLAYEDLEKMPMSTATISKDFIFGPYDMSVKKIYMLWNFTRN